VRQLDAELRRFFARRIVRGMFLLAALIVLTAVTIGTARGKPASTRTVNEPGAFLVPPGASYFPTPRGTLGGTGTYTLMTPDTRTNVGKDLKDVLEGTGVAMVFVAIVLGASFVGAEFHVGSLTTQLLFEPRRTRVHVSKAVAVAIGTGVVSFLVSGLIAASMYAGSELKGVVAGVDGTFWWDRLGDGLRVAATAALGGVMAYAVTTVTKRTSAAIVVFFVQFPLLFLIKPTSKPFGFISYYNPLRALLAVLSDPKRSNAMFENGISTVAGGVTLTVIWVLVLLAISNVIFARAEVR
jgi:ABC-type transport system involved in multi-copper enzyme maturation permease subunit